MKKILLLAGALCMSVLGNADTIEVKQVRLAGPFAVQSPYMVDSLDVNSKAYQASSILDGPLNIDVLHHGEAVAIDRLSTLCKEGSLAIVGFSIENSRYTTASIKVEGAKHYKCYVDGKLSSMDNIELTPKTHEVVIKYISEAAGEAQMKLTVESPNDGSIALREDGKGIYTLDNVLHNRRFRNVSLSPDGKYLLTTYTTSLRGGSSDVYTQIKEVKTKRIVAQRKENIKWMPKSSLYYYTRKGIDGIELVTVSPATGEETVIDNNIPEGNFMISPTEDFLIYTLVQEGPAEKEDIYEVIEPDDRQPGWRIRTYIARYSLKDRYMQPLTFGHHNSYPLDISDDGSKMLIMIGKSRLSKRPTTLASIYLMDLKTLEVTPLVEDDGFIASAGFSPDGKSIYIKGSPEALNRVGMNVKEGQTPSMFDYQLFLMNIADKKVTPSTRYFNPSIENVAWNRKDGLLYFTAQNRDYEDLYRLDPNNGKIMRLNAQEDLVKAFSMSRETNVLAYYGQSASNSDRMYMVNTVKDQHTLAEDLSKENLKDIELGECHAWNFQSSRGDTIYGRYYLPPHFDANKKYPMIVNYYGGCSPVERSFEGRYALHAYAALGYVVYVVEPSGASGFGQEFAARHVNTAGRGPAEDIIEGTRQFCSEHSFVDARKIGCIGASYGGFMTQYLQTQTDIFAAAISHAGISDHTSYWGEGYWGYSYSEVSMANSYPWQDRKLYVEQSPLYNAHKVNTPILFLHGDADHNVPVGESIQMYTALKLLGKDTAMVLVTDQDHHITDYSKRIKWEHTIYAWFAKWLQNDTTWWDALYPKKSL